MGRYAAEELYEGEYEEEERTRAAVSSVPSYDDQFEDRTRSARESHIALEGLANSAERARVAFVAPAEIEGERSPAMRARRQSFVDPSEVIQTPHRPSFVAASERRSRSERPGPVPAPPTPRPGSRHSFVASSEREDFASSAPDAEEVTSFRERPPSQHPVSRPASRRPAPISRQQPVRESTFAPAVESSEIEEVITKKPGQRASVPAAEERSRPVDYEALKNYLFNDVPAGSPEAAAMSEDDRSVSMQTPVAPISPRASHIAFRPAMHSIRPDRNEIAPAARISHHAFRPQSQLPGAVAPVGPSMGPQLAHLGTMPTSPQPMMPMAAPAFRPQMMTGPMMPQQMMAGPAPHESYVDSSWIVPTPQFPSHLSAKETGVFKVTLSFVAAAVTAVAALAVMIGAILFIRSEDTPPPVAPLFTVQPPVVAPVEPAKPVVVTPVEAPKHVVEKKAVEKIEKPVVEKTAETPKKKKVVAVQTEDGEEAPPPKAKPAKKTDKDKQVEQMLAELQEQQLNR